MKNPPIAVRMLAAFAIVLGLLVAGSETAHADVRLPSVIGSNMVLQRDAELPIWGWADPGEEVTVAVGDNKATATAGDDGKWSVKLAPLKVGKPVQMTISGKNKIALKNIFVGEVWVGSGQSNMQWSVNRAVNPQEEIAAAKYPNIRLFHVPRVPAGTPQDDVKAAWTECNPETVPGFSAVAYFFGRHLHKELDVPIGLIHTSWGGTRIEPWTPPVGFESVPKLAQLSKFVKTSNAKFQQDAAAAKAKQAAAPKHPLNSRGAPTGLYNGMVHALVPFAMRGAIWYQGEANRVDGMLYHEKMKGLIYGWRKIWKQGDFPFLFVQLAPYTYRGAKPTMLPELWEAQTATLAVKNTGMAVTTDIGNIKNIHPRNKQDVGKRLALWALAKTYGRENLVFSGPLYKSKSIEENKVRIEFDHIGGGLASRDGKPLTWFSIAGKDGKFVEAQAEIDGDSVLVSSDKVSKPVHVRFGWNQIAEPNLSNKDGLPASPFRTDR